MLLMPSELVDPLMRESHHEHVDGDGRDGVAVCLLVGQLPLLSGSVVFVTAGREFGRVRQRLWKCISNILRVYRVRIL
jgi:hypothetical protein